MRKKYFFGAVAMVLLMALGYVLNIELKNSRKPIFSCMSSTGIAGCGFLSAKCDIFKGAIVTTDGHPGPYTFYDCYKKSPDAGKECASNEDCVYSCDLGIVLKLNKCTLLSNEPLGDGLNGYNSGNKFFKKQYNCNTLKPGACVKIPKGGRNPGGVSYELKMEKQILIETQTGGPIF